MRVVQQDWRRATSKLNRCLDILSEPGPNSHRPVLFRQIQETSGHIHSRVAAPHRSDQHVLAARHRVARLHPDESSCFSDQYVLLGASRTSFAAGDAGSAAGTALLLTVAEQLRLLATREQWRPNRSVKLVSWGAAEHGHVGMRKYLEVRPLPLADSTGFDSHFDSDSDSNSGSGAHLSNTGRCSLGASSPTSTWTGPCSGRTCLTSRVTSSSVTSCTTWRSG